MCRGRLALRISQAVGGWGTMVIVQEHRNPPAKESLLRQESGHTLPGGDRFLVEDSGDSGYLGIATERPRVSEHLVQHYAERNGVRERPANIFTSDCCEGL
jgi:hypothetical protein